MKAKVKAAPAPGKGRFWDLYRDGVTQSFIQSWLRCRELARLGMVEGWTSAIPSAALSFGTMTHGCLEDLYGMPAVPTPAEVALAIKKQSAAFRAENPRANADLLSTHEQHCAVLQEMLPIYFQFWKADFKTMKWEARELQFELPFPISTGRTIKIRGKFDGVFWLRKELWLFETKTSGKLDEDGLADTLGFDLQNTVYLWAMSQLFRQRPNGVKYNVLRKPGSNPWQDESLKDYAARIGKDMRKKPAYYFVRFEVPLTQKEFAENNERLRRILEEIARWYETQPDGCEHFRNPTQCLGRFGQCGFLKICARGDYGSVFKRERPFNELA